MCKNPQKILFGMDSMAGGGAEKVLVNILENLDRKRFSPFVFLFVREGKNLARIPSDCQVFYMFDSFEKDENAFKHFFRRWLRAILIRSLRCFPWLFRLLVRRIHDYEVGVSFCEGINMLLFVAWKTRFKKIISWLHIDIAHHHFVLSKREYGRAILAFDKVVCISKGVREIFQSTFPKFPSRNVFVVYNPMNISEIRNKSRENLVLGELSDDCLLVLGVGRLAAAKRFDRLVNAFARVAAIVPNVFLIIMGYGAEDWKLRQQIDSLGMRAHARIIPYSDNPYSMMRRADIIVSSSDYEGMPLVVAEAMLLAKPIVATETPGSVELLNDGEFGILTPISEDGIFEGVFQFAKSKALREKYESVLRNAQASLPFSNSTSEIENLLSEA